MSIPERLGRIMRHKLNEMKDKFDQLDEEALADPAEIERLRRAESRLAANQEMNEALANPMPAGGISPAPVRSAPIQQKLRTPDQIAGAPMPPRTNSSASAPGDPLDYHYRMLGLAPGTDFQEVQRVYTSLSQRANSSRFESGTAEARELEEIRARLEASYRALRDALDTTAHRFGMLEFDPKPAGNS